MAREKITAKSCVTCGLCCMPVQRQDAFCDVSVEDLKRLDRRWVRNNVLGFSAMDRMLAAIDGYPLPAGALKTREHVAKHGPFRGQEVCACVALKGDPGHKVECRIYAKRPNTCRVAVVPGDETCRTLRLAHLKKARPLG